MNNKPSVLQEVWQKYEEGNHGVIYLYEKYERQLQKAAEDLDEADFKLLQEFYWRVVTAYKKLNHTGKLKDLCTRIIKHITTSERQEELAHVYHQALLAMLYYYVNNKESIKSELLSKRLINVDQVEDKYLYEQLRYESNKSYWSYWIRRHKGIRFWVSVIVLIQTLILTVGIYLGFNYDYDSLIVVGWINLTPFLFFRYATLANRDQVSIDLLEIWTVNNGIRPWLNKTFKLNLGYQKEIAAFNGTVLDILD